MSSIWDYDAISDQMSRGGGGIRSISPATLVCCLSALSQMESRYYWGDRTSGEFDDIDAWIATAYLELLTDASSGGTSVKYANLGYVLSAGTSAGTNDEDDWTQYPLNTILADDDSIITLTSNRFQIDAGEFYFNAEISLRGVGGCRIALYNYTQAMGVKAGNNTFTDNPRVTGYDVSNGADWYEMQYYASEVKTDKGLGRAIGSGDDEFYADVNIWLAE